MMEMLLDMFRTHTQAPTLESHEDVTTASNSEGLETENSNEYVHHDAEKFNDLIKDVDKELYPGCKKFNRLSFLLHLNHIKCRFELPNESFDMILKLVKEALPEGETLPNSLRESQKIIEGLGLKYEKIDACPNDYMLFWKEKAKDEECSICHASRWKVEERTSEENSSASKKKKKIPAKVLRYFPLNPRLQRLFMSSKIANDMTWHHKERKKDEILRHTANSNAWKSLDAEFPEFGDEP